MSDWKKLKRNHKLLSTIKEAANEKEILLNEIRQAVKELGLVEQGKLKSRTARALLDEL
jgi:hypothetical protein